MIWRERRLNGENGLLCRVEIHTGVEELRIVEKLRSKGLYSPRPSPRLRTDFPANSFERATARLRSVTCWVRTAARHHDPVSLTREFCLHCACCNFFWSSLVRRDNCTSSFQASWAGKCGVASELTAACAAELTVGVLFGAVDESDKLWQIALQYIPTELYENHRVPCRLPWICDLSRLRHFCVEIHELFLV